MSFFGWFKKLFSHFNAASYVKMLEVAKISVDNLATVEQWAWKPQFDSAMSTAIADLQNWQPGTPAQSVIQAFEDVLTIVEANTKALNQKEQATIAVLVSTIETVLTLIGK